MEISTVITITVCTIVIIGFTVFVLQKSKALKVKTEHGLDESTAELAEKMIDAGTGVADKVANTITNVADKVANTIDSTVAPLTVGIGQILESVADRVKLRQTEVNTLKTQAIALVQEVERLKNRQIDMTQVTAQLKLGLISISQQYSSWERTTIETEASGVFTQGSETEFISLHRANYQTQVGIDIEQLRFQMGADNRIQVFGLRNAEILGIKDLKVETVIDEVRKFTSEGTLRSGKAEIFTDDSRLVKLSSKHHSRVLDEIQNKQSIEHLKDTNARFAHAFLQACLSPGGFKVEESELQFENPLRFGELCQQINQHISDQINAKTSQQLQLDDRSRILEGEILEIVSTELKEPSLLTFQN